MGTQTVLQLIFCMTLTVLYMVHLGIVMRHRDSLGNPHNRNNVALEAFVRPRIGSMYPSKWAFALVIVILPIGIVVSSDVFASGGVLDRVPSWFPAFVWVQVSYHGSKAVFVIMVTLEVAFIFNLIRMEWRNLLTAALAIDVIAVLGYSLMGEPQAPARSVADLTPIVDPLSVILPTLFFALAGTGSFVSSIFTLYCARTLDVFSQGDSGDFELHLVEETDSVLQEGDGIEGRNTAG